MDCEPTTATSHPAASGPGHPESRRECGPRSCGYVEIGAEYGLPVTFFVHPEAADSQGEMFRELKRKRACLGLHMHPWKYSLWCHSGRRYLAAGLSPTEQKEILAESSGIWAKSIGHRPESGTGSACCPVVG